MLEMWNPVINYENLYEVSNFGNIRRISGSKGAVIGRILKPNFNKQKGYYYITLSKNCIQTQYSLHRIVAMSFLGESELQVNHKDGNKLNNYITNLEYMSCKNNLLHATNVLKKRCCESHWNSRLTKEQVLEIKSLKNSGITHQLIANKFNVSRPLITEIMLGRKWANI